MNDRRFQQPQNRPDLQIVFNNLTQEFDDEILNLNLILDQQIKFTEEVSEDLIIIEEKINEVRNKVREFCKTQKPKRVESKSNFEGDLKTLLLTLQFQGD